MTTLRYRHGLPELTVTHVRTQRPLGLYRGYTLTVYEVRSIANKVPDEVFTALDRAGLFGYGQGLAIEEPVESFVEAPLTEIDENTGLPTGRQPVNYRGEAVNDTHRYPTYTYTVTRTVDSTD